MNLLLHLSRSIGEENWYSPSITTFAYLLFLICYYLMTINEWYRIMREELISGAESRERVHQNSTNQPTNQPIDD